MWGDMGRYRGDNLPCEAKLYLIISNYISLYLPYISPTSPHDLPSEAQHVGALPRHLSRLAALGRVRVRVRVRD